MIDLIINFVTCIFDYTFLNYSILFAFYNIINHVYYIENIVLTKKLYLGMREK